MHYFVTAFRSCALLAGCAVGAFAAAAAEQTTPAFTPVINDGLVWVPAGTFQMGTPADYAGDHDPEECPQRPVTLTKGYWLGQTEVTNAQYGKFLEALAKAKGDDSAWRHAEQPAGPAGPDGKAKDHTPAHWTDTKFNQPNQPVVGVDWWDAYAYAKWAGGRLPTEAEWEYATRSTDARLFAWGQAWPPPAVVGNFADTAAKAATPEMMAMSAYTDGHATTAPAGVLPQAVTWCGAHDMCGNVWEWCNDRYAPYVVAQNTDPTGSVDATGRVVRGGSWRSSDMADLRCSFRDNYDPEYRADDMGFRIAKTGDAPAKP